MKKLLSLAAIALVVASCEKPATIPAYLSIDQYTFNAGNGNGTSSNAITDAWLTINGEFKGAYEIPFEVPILEEGTVSIKVEPGIKMNGISSTRIVYPFYTDFDFEADLNADSTLQVNPTATYNSLGTFEWMEDFEDAGYTLEHTNKSDSVFVLVNDSNAFEGNSIAFYMDTARNFFEGVSSNEFELPTTVGSNIFLEMDYKCDNPFTVGIFANTPGGVSQEQILRVNRSEEWNKIYVNLTPNVVSNFNANAFKVFFGAILENPDSAAVYIDNLKLIYL